MTSSARCPHLAPGWEAELLTVREVGPGQMELRGDTPTGPRVMVNPTTRLATRITWFWSSRVVCGMTRGIQNSLYANMNQVRLDIFHYSFSGILVAVFPALVVAGGQGHGSGSSFKVEIVSLYRDLAPRLLHPDTNLRLADMPHNEFHTIDKNIICGGDRMRDKCVKLKQNGGAIYANFNIR